MQSKNIIPMGHGFKSNAFLLFLVQNFLLRNQVLWRFPENLKKKFCLKLSSIPCN